jgi:hypothetical protein
MEEGKAVDEEAEEIKGDGSANGVEEERGFGVAFARRACVEKTVEMPTRKRKVGKTRSVGVKPFQSACFNGQ